MRIYDWEPFLRTWSAERYAVVGADRPAEPAGRTAEWLGFAPATEERLTALESRLGRPLPPSYRQFLAVTDGWRMAGEFVTLLGSTEQVGPLPELGPGVRACLDEWDAEDADDRSGEPVGDADVDPADEEVAHSERWARAILISAEGDQTWLLLDPGDSDAHGEWAAYSWSSWSGRGPVRHDSFAELMDRLYAQFRALRCTPAATAGAPGGVPAAADR
ncbi:SMI1/KNR4 family protein [Streptomyces sp. A1136]|uniref:SMI1/KNR4 family protein n=1 Tax=Streptomyces sp. A1136 TaxID=2563102 RepID=UPI00109EB83F|nr:SMI1/KNR4 family protein [Streptomyces sp. A1136]THA57489.1 SMI1/KNR4 family protein [Streptomyces sp. A1136]